MHLCFVAATFGRADSDAEAPAEGTLDDAFAPALQSLRRLALDFVANPASPRASWELEQAVDALVRELGRAGVEWAFNHVEPSRTDALPSHVHFEGASHTRLKRKTPQDVATSFGKVRLVRAGYRPTEKTGDPTIFPLARQLGIVAGATPALAERAARYQAEAGATQRRTLERLRQEHGVQWGVKKLREVVGCVAEAMTEERHEVQAGKLLHWLEQAQAGKGKHRPVLSVGRDGISFGVPVRKGTMYEVASAGTVTVLDRRGQRLGTVYLACTPESKQGTLSGQLTQLAEEVLRRWERPAPRLCYVTDAGDNETAYYQNVLRRMRHPRTGERLEWIRVVDYYHASTRLWTMAEALFGGDPAGKAWARRMQRVLKEPGGVRRVLNSAAALRSRRGMTGTGRREFDKAYNYLRTRTKHMRYAAYKRLGIPRGSGVTEAACKTIYTQRLKLSGMRWKKAGAQTILNLRVLLLSGVWTEAYQRMLDKFDSVEVPTYASINRKTLEMAA